jgi:hypothetical protein
MANLTLTTYYARRGLLFGSIAFVGILILRVSISLSVSIYKQLNPPPPPAPTVAFGKLPALVFPESDFASQTLNFKLETIEGNLPRLADVGRVYFMPKKEPSLTALDEAKVRARNLGFESTPEAVDKFTYRWIKQIPLPKVLTLNINNNNFIINYPFTNDQEVLNSKYLPSAQSAAQETKNFLSQKGFLPTDLATGSAEFVQLRFDPPDLVEVNSLSEADFLRVNLFRSDLDDLRIMPPNPKHSLVSLLFSGARDTEKRIVEIDYFYFPIDYETFATYPLKPLNLAWEELKNNQGYLAHVGKNTTGQAIIRRVTLGYFDSKLPQNFLQPIYIFHGDDDFFAYVSAIAPEWVQ